MAQDVPIGSTQISLAQLNERSREIFRQIVESYLSTGEPLGSRNLSRLITTVWSSRADRGAEERLALDRRETLIPIAALRRDAHLEMHTRGG